MLTRRGQVRWPREIARQLTHPLALLLWLAAMLSFAVGSTVVGVAVVIIIILNAAFATDVVLPGDLALLKAIERAYHLGHLPSEAEEFEAA